MKPRIILASTSPFRKELLERIGLPFRTASPNIDETPEPDESPLDLVHRLSVQKSRVLRHAHPGAVIIGSDQVAVLNGKLVGKPGNHDNAVSQLREASGCVVQLYAGVALFNTDTENLQYDVDTFEVEFRTLSHSRIERYLELEKPYNCCGSLKAEGPGIALLKRLSGNDPNTLIGLPIIKLIRQLENEGITLY